MVKFALHLPNVRGYASLQYMVKLSQEAEKLGFSAVASSDHLLYPESYPKVFGPSGFFEAFTTLHFIAGQTKGLALGTSVILPLRGPLVTAVSLSMLDNATGGKSFLGTGVGWYEPEFTASSVDFKRRGKLYEEWLDVIRQLLSGKPVTYSGAFFRMENAELFPKPLQKPHPPLMLGGSSRFAAKRIARYGDGWLPYMASLEDIEHGMTAIKEAWRRERRSGEPRLMADFWTVIDKAPGKVESGSKFLIELSSRPPWKASLETIKNKNLLGTPREIASRIEGYVKLGVEQIILGFPPYGKELDMMKLYSSEVIPLFN